MNSSRSRCLSGALPFLHVAVCLCLCGAELCAAPRRSPAPTGKSRGAQADAFPQADQPAGEDLKLGGDDEKMAGALASYVDGFMAEDNADTERALQAYQHSLALDPGNSTLAVKVAIELARRGDAPQAVSVLKDASKYAPHDPEPCLYLAQFYAKFLKKPEMALKFANQAIDLAPANFAAYVSVYELYVGTNDLKNAEQILDRAASLPHDDAPFWLQLTDLYMRLFLKDEEAALKPEAVKKLNATLGKAVVAAGGDPLALSKAADYYVVMRQIKDAIRLYLEVVKLKPNTDDPALAKTPEKLVRSYLAIGQRDQAIALLQKLIEQNPRLTETHELLGQLYEEDGKLDEALECFHKSLALNDKLPLTHLHVADVLMRQKKSDEAIETLRMARKKAPEVPQMTYSLALAYSQMKRHKDALATFEEAFQEAQATQPEMLGAAFYFSYGATAEQAGEVEKAVELLKKSIDLDPQHADQPSNYLGYMWVDRGEHLDEAGELIHRAVQMAPDNGAYLDSLGWFYFKKGEFKHALDDLLKAAQNTKPEDATVFEHLGDTYQALNDTANALVYWQKAATLDPENKKLPEKIDGAKQKVTSNPPVL